MNIIMETSAADTKQHSAKADSRPKAQARSAEFGETMDNLVQCDRANSLTDMGVGRANSLERVTDSHKEDLSASSTTGGAEAALLTERLQDATRVDHEMPEAEIFISPVEQASDSEIGPLFDQEQLTLSMVKEGYKLSGTAVGSHLSAASLQHQTTSSLTGINSGGNPSTLPITTASSGALSESIPFRVTNAKDPIGGTTSAVTFDRLTQDFMGLNTGAPDKQRMGGLNSAVLHTHSPADSPQSDKSTYLATSLLTTASGGIESPLGRSAGSAPLIEVSARDPQTFASSMATHLRVIKNQGGGEAKVNLHPAELGRMSVSVITEGSETKVTFMVETSQARQAIEASLPRLREMFEQAGLTLSDSNVSEQNRQSKADDESAFSRSRGLNVADADDTSDSELSVSVHIDPDRLLDTYV